MTLALYPRVSIQRMLFAKKPSVRVKVKLESIASTTPLAGVCEEARAYSDRVFIVLRQAQQSTGCLRCKYAAQNSSSRSCFGRSKAIPPSYSSHSQRPATGQKPPRIP
eukprot:6213059-Pleurochrysis_carterae.AAC.4